MKDKRKSYPSDLSDGEWARLEVYLPVVKSGGRPAKYERREIVNGIFYVLRTGGSWRMLPHDFPPWESVYGYFRRWCEAGVWEAMMMHVSDDPDRESVLLDSTIVRAHPCAAGAPKKWRTGEPGAGA